MTSDLLDLGTCISGLCSEWLLLSAGYGQRLINLAYVGQTSAKNESAFFPLIPPITSLLAGNKLR